MNVFNNGDVMFHIKIEEVSCFYFCDHFYKAFRKKEPIKNASVLRSHPLDEVIDFCCSCCIIFAVKSKACPIVFFNEAKKNLIQ